MYGVVLQVPGEMYGEISSAPTSPPPGPTMPALFGGCVLAACSWQQAVASDCGLSDSSAVMISSPCFLKAGDWRIRGAQTFRKALTDFRPPGRPSSQPVS